MAEFTPIETQEQLDSILKSRLERERSKYSDYEDLKAEVAAYKEQIGGYKAAAEDAATKQQELTTAISEKEAQIAAYETASVKTKIALQMGIPYEMASRLAGTTEDEIRADAETLAGLLKTSTAQTVPVRNQEAQNEEDGVMAAFRKLNPNLKI